jgi:tRNA threonylcarbamoyladenosine biosynthesis protein TsaB
MGDTDRRRLHSNIAISMLVLALDTTTRIGSLALVRDGAVLEVCTGDPGLTHGQRLPGDIISLLGRQHVAIADVDLYAVAAGPGSFTGLRIGIATMQGLALASGRGLVGVSALDALGATVTSGEPGTAHLEGGPPFVGAWIDAHRGEVFAALYRVRELLDGPTAEPPDVTVKRWADLCPGLPLVFVGGGALLYADSIRSVLADNARVVDPVPPLAPAIARLGEMRALAGGPTSAEAVQPLYVRRPDVEIARDRRRG